MTWYHKDLKAPVGAFGGFPIIYADPPWSYSNSGKAVLGAANKHYETMALKDICALPVGDLAAKDCALFMWGTYPLLPEMLQVGKAWGFSYKTIAFQWVKRFPKAGHPVNNGPGYFTRSNTEGCFLFVRGKPKRVNAGISQLIETFDEEIVDAPRGRHSAKPPIVRDRIVALMGDLPAIELFAREPAPGWECWGNEVTSTIDLISAS